MVTDIVAAGGLTGLGASVFGQIVFWGVIGAMALAIFLSLKYSVKAGIGAGIGVFFGGVFLAILISNIVAIKDFGNQEVRRELPHSNSIYTP